MLTVEVTSTYMSIFVHVYQSKGRLALCPAWTALFLFYNFMMELPFMCDFSPVHLSFGADSLMVLCLWFS